LDVNSQIQGMLGTASNGGAVQGNANSARSDALPASVQAIATNGSLLVQNISKLTETLDSVLTDLGAP
jgi:hypothetical protein